MPIWCDHETAEPCIMKIAYYFVGSPFTFSKTQQKSKKLWTEHNIMKKKTGNNKHTIKLKIWINENINKKTQCCQMQGSQSTKWHLRTRNL